MEQFIRTYKGGVDNLLNPHLHTPGVMTGFPSIDEATDGFHPDEIWVLGAYSSSGKTAMSLQIARMIAERGEHVAIFSQEMSQKALFYRMICDEALVNLKRFRSGQYGEEEADRLKVAAAKIAELPLHIDSRSGISPLDYSIRLKALQDKYPIVLSVVDYVQLMKPLNSRASGADRMSSIAINLQDAVKETHVPLLLLSQLSRDQAKNKRRPEMHDLKDSSSLEAISDIVMMIYREEVFSKDKTDTKGASTLHIRKSRNAATCDIPLKFIAWRMRFEEPTDEDLATGAWD
jgi:replicative DNA helicase